jgi:hypothetical protein
VLGRESLYRMKKKYVSRCTWQKHYNGNVMVKFQLQCQQIHSNTLKYIEIYYKCIEIFYKHIKIYHKYTMNTFKYTTNTFKYTIHMFKYTYIRVLLNVLKYIKIYYKCIKIHHIYIISTFEIR